MGKNRHWNDTTQLSIYINTYFTILISNYFFQRLYTIEIEGDENKTFFIIFYHKTMAKMFLNGLCTTNFETTVVGGDKSF